MFLPALPSRLYKPGVNVVLKNFKQWIWKSKKKNPVHLTKKIPFPAMEVFIEKQ